MNNNDKVNQPGKARWEDTQTVGSKIVDALEGFVAHVESGAPVEEKFTVRTVELELEPRKFTAEEIKAIRKSVRASQEIFARMLGAKVSAVQSWEQGRKEPGGMACRLLEVMEQDPSIFLAMLSGAREHRPVAGGCRLKLAKAKV